MSEPKFLLVVTRHGRSEVLRLESDSLDDARREADRRLMGDPKEWTAGGARVYDGRIPGIDIAILFTTDHPTLLHPAFVPWDAKIVLFIEERPAREFWERMERFATENRELAKREIMADPEWAEFARLSKKFMGEPKEYVAGEASGGQVTTSSQVDTAPEENEP